jgi:hypothetical protein
MLRRTRMRRSPRQLNGRLGTRLLIENGCGILTVFRSFLFTVAVILMLLVVGNGITTAQEPNVGLLRADLRLPRQVAPNSAFSVTLDVEYAVRYSADISAAIFKSTRGNLTRLWQSDHENVTGGGDRIWTIDLTAPAEEGYLNLTAYAYYLDEGTWRFYSDPVQGPGISEATVKIGKNANLEVELGTPGVAIAVNNGTVTTASNGSAQVTLPVGGTYVVNVTSTVELQNATRMVFRSWNDGINQTQRSIFLDGDMKLVGSYKTQYLLQVNSVVSSYSKWYDAGSNVTVQSAISVPMNWPLDLLGMTYHFVGWSGDASSQSPQINITINSPRTVNANFSVDYGPLIIPAIFGIGIAGSAVIVLIRRRRRIENVPDEVKHVELALRCTECGEVVEKGWAHCIRCGAALGGSESVEK